MIIEHHFMNNKHYSKETWSKSEKILITVLSICLTGLIIYGVMQ